jgi:protein required for attachment to host cells
MQNAAQGETMPMEWFVAASRSQAKIFKRQKPEEPLQYVETLYNPSGRSKNREFTQQKPRSSRDSVDAGKSPHERAADLFAKRMGDIFEKYYAQKRFSRLTIFVEPRLMGKMKTSLKSLEKNCPVVWSPKDLAQLPATQLQKKISKLASQAPEEPGFH